MHLGWHIKYSAALIGQEKKKKKKRLVRPLQKGSLGHTWYDTMDAYN